MVEAMDIDCHVFGDHCCFGFGQFGTVDNVSDVKVPHTRSPVFQVSFSPLLLGFVSVVTCICSTLVGFGVAALAGHNFNSLCFFALLVV